MKKERKLKERQEKKVTDRPAAKSAPIDRRHLHNYRVVQRNLVYVIGLPGSISSEEILKKSEYFGQYGKIVKTVIHKNSNSAHATASAYVTFAHKEDAKACIQALEGFWLDGHHIRASFGTTKYCNNFIKGTICNNPDCVYLHDIGEDEDRFTKEEIQAGYSKLIQAPGKDQVLITGNGGPSGTGKRLAGEPVLPPPVFIQDIVRPDKERETSSSSKPSAGVRTASSSGDLQQTLQSEQSAADSTASTDKPTPGKMPKSNSNSTMDHFNSSDTGSNAHHHHQQQQQQQHRGHTSEDTAVPGLVFTVADGGSDSGSRGSAMDSSGGNSGGGNKSVDKAQGGGGSNAVPAFGFPADSGRGQQQVFQQQAAPSASSFNGLGRCAVFPVPTSSLVNSIWTSLLQSAASYPDLSMNPYGQLTLSVSDLLEVTLPPVDAASLTAWPRPQSYYKLGMTPGGVTHCPPGQHTYHPPISSNSMPPSASTGEGQGQGQQQQQQQQTGGSDNISYSAVGKPGSSQHDANGNGQGSTTVESFKQIFPGVNMTFGGPPRQGTQQQQQHGHQLQGR
jgi:hypothetical protein